jgi:hypothetical protein
MSSSAIQASGEVLPIIAEEGHLYCGPLHRVDGQIITVGTARLVVEVPLEIAEQLRPLIGQNVLFGSIARRFRAGKQSHRRPWP